MLVLRPLATLLLLSSLTFVLGLGRPAITDSDEAYYAEAAREMVESGDWLTPHFNYADRWQKPILYYWMTALTYEVTGPTETAARLWSAFSGVGLVLLTWLIARRMFGTDEVGWLAGAIVATAYGYFAMARMALPDLPLAFFITATIWAALERRPIWIGIAAGLGFLDKGPLALVVPAVVLLPLWWRERRIGTRSTPASATHPLSTIRLPLRFHARDFLVAGALFAIVGLPWYGAMTLAHGDAYIQSFFVGDNLERFTTTRFNEPRALWFYLPIVIGGMLPWSMYLLVLPWKHGIAVVRRQTALTLMEWRLVVWMLAPLIFFTLSIGKQPRYVLPVLPPLAILLAQSLMARIRAGAEARRSRGLVVATWLTAAFCAALILLLWRVRALFTASPMATGLGLVAIAASGGALAWTAARGAWKQLPVIMASAGCVILLTVQFGALAGVRPEPVEAMAQTIRAHRAAEPVGVYQVFVRNLPFYTGVKQLELYDDRMALEFLRSSERVLLVVRAQDLQRLEASSGMTARRLGEVRYLNTANIKLSTLLAPAPERTVETIVLATNR